MSILDFADKHAEGLAILAMNAMAIGFLTVLAWRNK